MNGLLDVLPSIGALAIVGFTVSRLSRYPILQIFLLIVTVYTIAFPMIDHVLSLENFKYPFAFNQAIFAALFILPLSWFLFVESKRVSNGQITQDCSAAVSFNRVLPWILSAHAALFLGTAIVFDLFFIRLGYADFLQTYGGTPPILLFHHRIAVEMAFFVMLFIISVLRLSPRDSIRRDYRLALLINVLAFGMFFLVNSRMQFLLFIILMLSSNYRLGRIDFWKLAKLVIILSSLVIALTLLRELVIEENDRLYGGSSLELLRQTLWLVAARLDSVIMINMASETAYNIFEPHLEGLWFFVKFNTAPLLDPAFYAQMKATEMTSPSVWMSNGILRRNDVDFPKSMMVEMLLMFGAFLLPLFAFLLAKIAGWVQARLRQRDVTDVSFILALYILPLLFQFEKEFTGFLLSLLKWLPMLVLLVWLRPVRESGAKQRSFAYG